MQIVYNAFLYIKKSILANILCLHKHLLTYESDTSPVFSYKHVCNFRILIEGNHFITIKQYQTIVI